MAMAVERALISVFDKTGIAEFAKRLAALRIEILSTGGTAKLLRDAGVAVRDVAEFTGWPEMLGGRVKTLHPKVHAGLLFRRNHAEDKKEAGEHGIAPIDLVAVNLYPFEATAAKASFSAEELIENIDIGGPALLRSAAKNFASVTVVTDSQDYERVAAELESSRETSLVTRLELARKVYATTSRYDGMITMELERLSAAAGRVELGAKPLLPEVEESDLQLGYSGLRPKLVPPGGKGYADFVITRDPAVPQAIHLVGMESPGLTAAPAIAAHVAKMVEETMD